MSSYAHPRRKLDPKPHPPLAGTEKAGHERCSIPRGEKKSRYLYGPNQKELCPETAVVIWEFPKTRGTLFWGPCNKDPTF